MLDPSTIISEVKSTWEGLLGLKKKI